MNSDNKVPESTVAPAAALLFQAPTFTEPVFSKDSSKAGDSAPGSRNQSRSKGRAEQGASDSEKSESRRPESKQADPRQSESKQTGAKSSARNGSAKAGKQTKGQSSAGLAAENKDEPGGGAGQKQTAAAGSSGQGTQGKKSGKKKRASTPSDGEVGEPDPSPETTSAQEASAHGQDSENTETPSDTETSSTRRRRRRTRSSSDTGADDGTGSDQVQGLKGSTRLEAKRMRRREGRRENRRRQSITEAEFLARREAVNREMVVRHLDGSDQIAVLEDGILVEHFVARKTTQSIVGNIYLGRVQNVLPSMEAAFIDVGRGRNAVLYAGEVNWDVLGMEGKPRRIETALKSGDTVMVQVTKDPIGHKGARLTSQITLAGRYLVFVPGSSMLGISRKLPDAERNRLKRVLRQVVPEDAGVIVRTAAEGASEEQLRDDVERLMKQWSAIQTKAESTRKAPTLLRGEPELVVRVVRDIFNEDFSKLVVQGNETWTKVSEYVEELSPELSERLEHWTSRDDVFQAKKVQQQLSKAMDRKVWLPSGGTLVIERTEALTVVDVNTGRFVGSGGTLEETVTRNNLEAAEEIVRQLRLRDIGGIVIIDFVDMVLESNRELVLRRLVECLGRDRTRHQVTEITSLGLVQMTRKRVGEGLVEAFSTTCDACEGRGFIVHDHPVETGGSQARDSHKRTDAADQPEPSSRAQNGSGRRKSVTVRDEESARTAPVESHVGEEKVRSALTAIAAATRQGDESASKEDVETIDEPVEVVEVKPKTGRSRRGGKKAAGKAVTIELPEPAQTARRASERKPSSAGKAKSLDDIALPQPVVEASSDSESGERKAGRRVAVRAAGSPPTRGPVTEQ